MSFKDHFNEVEKNGVVLYCSGNWNIMLYKNKCYSIAINKSCISSFFGDMDHIYSLILQQIDFNCNVYKNVKRFISLKKYFNNYDLKKTRLKYYLNSIKQGV